jgi:hypothetical protein
MEAKSKLTYKLDGGAPCLLAYATTARIKASAIGGTAMAHVEPEHAQLEPIIIEE